MAGTDEATGRSLSAHMEDGECVLRLRSRVRAHERALRDLDAASRVMATKLQMRGYRVVFPAQLQLEVSKLLNDPLPRAEV